MSLAALFQPRRQDIPLDWARIQDHWPLAMGRAQAQWNALTEADLQAIAGRRDRLAGRLQARYGLAPDEAEEQIAEWQHRASEVWFQHEASTF